MYVARNRYQPKIMVQVLELGFWLTVAKWVIIRAGWVDRCNTWTLQPSDRSVGATVSPRRPQNHVANLGGPDDTYARLNRTGSSVFGYTDFMRVAVDAAGQRVTLKASARSTAGTYVPIVTHDYC